jgi:hypothetical protein
MRQVEKEIKSGQYSEQFLDLFEEDPFYFAAYRVYYLLAMHGRVMSSSVPFVHRLFFLPAILLYITVKRLTGIAGTTAPVVEGHVFCCHSTADYKIGAFFELFDAIEEPTTVLAVEGAKRRFLDSEDRPEDAVVTFGETFTRVSPIRVLRALPWLWRITREVGDGLEVESTRYRIVVFNFLVTEHVKSEALHRSARSVDSFHTYSPAPYQITSIPPQDIYAYQHGIETDHTERSFAIPPYVPINYFVWGAPWKRSFERKAHPEASIYAVGSPRLDRMFRRHREVDPTYDVLFISGSHVIGQDNIDAHAYRGLVETVVGAAVDREWSLKIKLHPIETPERYEEWGYEAYVTSENDLEDLLRNAAVAVTDVSSAFIESVVMGTPIVVAQQSLDRGLDRYGVPGAIFPDSTAGVRRSLGDVHGRHISQKDLIDSDALVIGDSVERIADILGATLTTGLGATA